jgi:outer membrane protein assembly factor BamB
MDFSKMITMKKYFYPLLAGVALFVSCAKSPVLAQPASYIFEDLGKPIRFSVDINFVTRNAQTGDIAWAGLTSATRSALIGINEKNGKLIDVDFTPYGKGNAVNIFKQNDKTIYIYAGNPGRFFKYDVDANKLTTIGAPSQATYWMGAANVIAPDGKIYVGTYPNVAVSVLDPATDTTKVINKISDDPKEEYVISLAAAKDGTMYFGVGMQHGELWSYNPQTGAKQQILPKNLQTYSAPQLWTGADGNVYGAKGKSTFTCFPDKIEIGAVPERPATILDNETNGKTATLIDKDGNLELVDKVTGKITKVPSSFEAPAHALYNISDVHDGKLYGSSFKPGPIYSFDLITKKLDDLGFLTRGHVQVYDILSYGKGILMSSYVGGYLDYYLPNEPRSATNPLPVAALHSLANQERALQLTLGPDGNIYAPTVPIKGYLGGALVRVNPTDWKVKIYSDVIHNQSFSSVVSVPQTNELFVTSSIAGGSSSKPTEKEAWVFLWNSKTEQIDFKAQPIPGATGYSKAVRAPSGMIYGFAADKFYVFDPVKRQTIFTGNLPGRIPDDYPRAPLLSDEPASDGLIYGVDSTTGNLFSINPANSKITILAKDKSLIDTHFARTETDGYMYYNNGARLMRVKVVGK